MDFFTFFTSLKGIEVTLDGNPIDRATLYHKYPSFRESIAKMEHPIFEYHQKKGWHGNERVPECNFKAAREKRIERIWGVVIENNE